MQKNARLRYLFSTIVFISALALTAFFKAWTFAPHTVESIANRSSQDASEANAKNNPAYVAYAVSNGWHTGLIVPASRINALLPGLKQRFSKPGIDAAPEPAYYEIGWGDQGFYEASEITVLMSLRALFYSPGSVMHVVAVNNPAQEFSASQLVKFCLQKHQLADLEKFIVSSFAYDAAGQTISRRPGLYGDSQFFKGAGTYHFLNSCNTWTAKALRSAGFDISPTFKMFSAQVMNNIDVKACQATM
jgi:uncharacterized protein (TIGR02117 family)